MFKSRQMSPCPKCSNHGKTVVNHCPYWDCQCTSCKQTDILAALKLEHSQLMQGLNPDSLQKISIKENQRASQDRKGRLNNKRSEEPKSLLECKVKVTDERKMDNFEPVKQIYHTKSLAGVDENKNCVQNNAKGNLIKKEIVEHRNYSKQESKGGFDIKSEYIEFESNMSELLAKPTIVNKTLEEIDNLLESKIFVNLINLRAKFDKFESKIVESLMNLKDIKKEDNGLETLKDIKIEVKKNNTKNEDDIVSTQNEGSVQTNNLSLKLPNVSSKSENLLDASNPNTINPTPLYSGVKELPTVNPKRETVVVKDLPKTQCPQSLFVTPIGTLSNFTSCKGIKMKEINSLLERKIVEKEGIGLKNLKDIKTVEDSGLKIIKTEVHKNETKETEKCSITQDLETNKFGQKRQNHSPDQKHEKNVKIEGNPKVKSETSPVSSFDVAQENAIQNFRILPDFVTKVEKGKHISVTSALGNSPGRVRFRQGTLVKNITNALDPLITAEFKVQKSKEVKVDTFQFEAGNNNNPDLKRLNCPNNEKKQLRSKRPKFDKKKMLEKPKRRVYMKKNMIEKFKFGGGNLIEANRKDCGYREGGVNDAGGYNRDSSGYSVGNTYGGYRDYQGCQGKGRWRGNDVCGGGTESFRYKEENVHDMDIDGGGYNNGYSGGRYGRYRNIGEYRGGGYQGDIADRNGGYRSEYGDGRNSGGGFIGGGGRDGGGYEESRGDCAGYGKGKGGVRDYGRSGRGGGYGGGPQY